ncbi:MULTISPECIES: hypothetical protein [Bacillus cereus group]|uniref:Uncharacterized protein n=1 Tax=Bacillus thuringiensis TaxID=1428 RepID=A0A1C4FX94_BACTU|nr:MULTISPECIES: hypothetical protein [Bacillus cereus group]MED3022323.1 hypothetical protein [Bacillus wiedmannii]SCC60476.1 Protein of unknown function [Bacillus thuringiensis]
MSQINAENLVNVEDLFILLGEKDLIIYQLEKRIRLLEAQTNQSNMKEGKNNGTKA